METRRYGRWFIRTGGFLGAALLTTLCLTAELSAGAAPERKSLDIHTARDAQLASQLVIAQTKGFFREEGIQVQIKYFTAGSEIPPGMAAGSIVMASAGAPNAISLAASNFPMRVIAQIADISGAQGIVVRSQAGIRVPKDLEGKRLGIVKAGPALDLFGKFSRTYQVDQSKITMANMLPPDLLTAFVKGDIDAYAVWEPYLTRGEQAGGKLLHTGTYSYVPGAEGAKRIFSMACVLFTLESFLKDNPNTTVAVLRSLRRAQQFLENPANAEAVLDILTEPLNIPKADLRKIMGRNRYQLQIDQALLDSMDSQTEFLHSSGFLRSAPKARTYVEPRFLGQVDPALVKIR
ncbi:MAG: ABC transporter substrate-binding protein [Candidatus Rokubacteria bacterium]|nr:ABC transporter substrate-binding protein [Candidatus Rokubacteria bacterium]